MNSLNILKTLSLCSAGIMLASCTSLNGAIGSYFGMDTDLHVDFVVDADINPDETGKASPLFVRMYELKTPKMIGRADFIDIYERDKEVLGEDLVSVHKLRRFKPGESRAEHYVLDKKANYVAFYAEFLKFKDSKYKVVVPVVANNVFQSTATVRVSGNVITVETSDGTEYKNFVNGENVGDMTKGAKDSAEKAQGAYDGVQGMY